MNRLAILACAALATACGGTVRYSRNPIGRAQFVGVAIAGDVGEARRVTDTWSRGLLPYPVYFRTDHRQLVDEARRRQAKGALRLRFMKLLGKPLPDWTVRDAAGKRVALRALVMGKVTVLALFLADEAAPSAPRAGLAALREAYRDFGEGLARPGPRWVENAKPD